ncbi:MULTISPECIES: hypothetical protein [Thermomonospora]|uniref:Uncharacterized protein n=1 Tax=Thermomonospora curvata (strain ATCC 19995 / DSM 43183 / JCM 3096 / KCTC 9072 / NBRC 15933 / NCIMB 10081 / Henssen B9) TaxID=471852 RepID=D1A4M0_THECD|nr:MULTISPECIES: hypothetical protein [Thermomonospora]ACY96255.1 hypothetical protein Tcur_0660 [Thermomonospora curvata DSM 43183]PKK15681.1 MAG: hypothetical protein BUE48_003240 [Thermomonospora sp. CIF 1]
MTTMTVQLGAGYWLLLGPALIALGLIIWLMLTLRAARHRPQHPEQLQGSTPHRGPIQGGIMEGDPGQRNANEKSFEPRS